MTPVQFTSLVTTWITAIENLIPVLLVFAVMGVTAYKKLMDTTRRVDNHDTELNGNLDKRIAAAVQVGIVAHNAGGGTINAGTSNSVPVDSGSNSVPGYTLR